MNGDITAVTIRGPGKDPHEIWQNGGADALEASLRAADAEAARQRAAQPDEAQTAAPSAELPEGAGQPRQKRRAEPLEQARRVAAGAYRGRILCYQGELLVWHAGAYRTEPPDAARASCYAALEAAGERANARAVSDVLDALRAVVRIDHNIEAPSWLDGRTDNTDALVPVRNGILDLRTGSLHPATPALLVRHSLPVDHDAEATAPTWASFLEQVMPPDAVATLQEVFGLLLTPDTAHQKIFLLVGPTRSGKGTVLRVIRELLGPEACGAPTLSSLAGQFGLADILDKSVACISDARLGGAADAQAIVERLLSISGEDAITVSRKFLPDAVRRLRTRFVVATNELPRLSDTSGALANRFIVLPFPTSFLGREDHTLSDRLRNELPGILTWAAAGWRRLAARGHFVQPASGVDAMEQMHDLSSPLRVFLRERCVLSATARVAVDAAYTAFREWSEATGRQPSSREVFGRDLSAAAPTIRKLRAREGESRLNIYEGLGLATKAKTTAFPADRSQWSR